MKRIHFHLPAQLEAPSPQANETGDESPKTAQTNGDEYLVTMLVGDATYNGLFFPTDEIEKAHKSMEGQPFNLDHTPFVEWEVGFVRQPQMFGSAFKGVVVLNPQTAKYPVAKAHIHNRFAAGKTPEVSVEVFLDVEERPDGVFVARNLAFDSLALVTRGACSPADGCGIGLKRLTPMTPTPEKPADPTPEAKPCGCGDKLKADIVRLTQERDAANQSVAALKQQLADAPKRAKLAAEAETLGAPVDAADGVSCLEKKIEIAKAVAAKLAQAPVRRTAPNLEGNATHEELADQAVFRLVGGAA